MRPSQAVWFLVVLVAGAGSGAQPSPARDGGADVAAADLIVLARLVEVPPLRAGCGTLHIAQVMRYEVVRVLAGSYTQRTLLAVHGCPEMTRAQYGGARGGTLTHFTVGEVHRLELRVHAPGGVGAPSALDTFHARALAALPRFWVSRADPAP